MKTTLRRKSSSSSSASITGTAADNNININTPPPSQPALTASSSSSSGRMPFPPPRGESADGYCVREEEEGGLYNDGDDDSDNKSGSSARRRRPSRFVLHVTAVASLGGILFGYDLGVVSAALPPMIEAFELTNRQSELVVSVLYVGGGIGALLGGALCDSFGRKRSILFTDAWFLLGAVVLFAAPSLSVVVVGRIVVGFALAVSGCVFIKKVERNGRQAASLGPFRGREYRRNAFEDTKISPLFFCLTPPLNL